jgi:hypothetical protein
MLDAYYCTTGGVVQGTSHPVQYSRACSGASSSRECGRRESTIHHGVSRAHFPAHCATRLGWLLLGGHALSRARHAAK